MAGRPGGSGCARRLRFGASPIGAALVICLFVTSPLNAADKGGGDRAAKEAARRAIPWRVLRGEDRQAVDRIVGDATLYRQLPTRVIDCDPELFAYLVDHPEVVVDVWRVMGVSRLELEAKGPGTYRATDAAGAVGDVRVLHREGGGADPLRLLVLADGAYQTPPMPATIRGSSVLLMRADATQEANGRTYMTVRLDSFVRFDRPATELVARTLKPLIVRTADHNFIETMRFVSLFSRTAETNPDGMQRLASRLDGVDATTRREFALACHQTATRSERRQRARVAVRQPANWR
ncbi:hypothetical protein MalM25_09580 [Planctomycetes bacterium MalM25]|nr:hypothetical protein MalM25_09580 [Planctomycetes bacterium MalM25]